MYGCNLVAYLLLILAGAVALILLLGFLGVFLQGLDSLIKLLRML